MIHEYFACKFHINEKSNTIFGISTFSDIPLPSAFDMHFCVHSKLCLAFFSPSIVRFQSYVNENSKGMIGVTDMLVNNEASTLQRFNGAWTMSKLTWVQTRMPCFKLLANINEEIDF